MNRVVLFDGECNMCNSAVQFIIKRDSQAKFLFTSLQSEKGKELLRNHKLSMDLNSMVYIKNNKAFTRSTAVLLIARELDGLWPITSCAFIIPGFIRDFVYRYVAKNRLKWFGKKDLCRLPTAKERARFLE
ncbi:thiol-disulfide oxidoreductase DCC family protein [Mangrovibacillus cuniculi]|uniref:Thiol-disulfide oxidoreductase DCC family protein n=1 Tax=Mangrovibacillus cuniculi TaxID=2593652 RepID=A0A7S8CAK5_9BACI|nr:thiol-disulfide oxidoreductase DCC family protein [Mangrovibacillus cuniculi]QPC46435.1 thiol-disulfide oxidoreductase DCC family protein [Mangrovibacillus cuniculi]